MTPARTRARRGEGALLRQEILAAADELLSETASDEAVSIRAIAERVGVTPPSIYRHFADKDELLFHVCERSFATLDRLMEESAAGAGDPFEALLRRGITYVRFGLDHPEHYRLLFMHHKHDHVSTRVDDRVEIEEVVQGSRAFNHLVDAADAILVAARRHRRRDLPSAFELALQIWTMVHGITSLRITTDFPWPSVEEQVRQLTDVLRARYGPR